MTDESRCAAVGFHSGELAVQRRAGVQADAARLAPMIGRAELRARIATFLSNAGVAALTARDRTGRLWTSALLGAPGLLHAASPTVLQINTTLADADPLHGLPVNQPVGMIAIDFGTRRRIRINGLLTEVGDDGLRIAVDQAYGNCPKYIRPRDVQVGASPKLQQRSRVYQGAALRPADIDLVRAADTFFLGTIHPESGNDASHRGGPPGFVSATPEQLCWADYPGNNMFNSFGNLSVDPTAALLFINFATAAALQLSGRAEVHWTEPAQNTDTPTGRQVEFHVEQVVVTTVPKTSDDGRC